MHPKGAGDRQALDQFADESIEMSVSLRLAATCMARYGREIVLPDQRRAVTTCILERLGKRNAGMAGIQVLLKAFELALSHPLGLDAESSGELIRVIKAWFSETPFP